MKILIMSDYPSPHLVDLFTEYSNMKECQVEFVFSSMYNKDRPWSIQNIEFNYKYIKASYIDIGRFRIKFSYKYLMTILKNQYDYVIFYDAYFQPITIITACWLILQKKKWGFFLEPRFKTKKRSKLELMAQKFIQYYLKKATFILTTGNNAVKYWQNELNNNNIYNLPYYRDLQIFKNDLISDIQSTIKFLYVGRFIGLKRVDIAIKSAISLLNNGYELELHLVGDGPLIKKMKNLVPKKYHEKIIFYGNIDYSKTIEIYKNCHIFVFPSTDDGWGMVVPEALASGLPVISTLGVNSAIDFIVNGYNGYLCSENDQKEIEQSMKFFLDNKKNIYQFSINARNSIQKYTPKEGANKLLNIILQEEKKR